MSILQNISRMEILQSKIWKGLLRFESLYYICLFDFPPTVWKSSHFPASLIFHEINFGWFQKVKNSRFNNFGCFLGKKKSHFKMSKAAQMVQITVFGASTWPELISRKIWVAEKSCHFHIVSPLLSTTYALMHVSPSFSASTAHTILFSYSPSDGNAVLFQWRRLWFLGHPSPLHVGTESRVHGSNHGGQVVFSLIAKVTWKWFSHDGNDAG